MSVFIMAMQINRGAKKAHPDLSHQVNESLEIFTMNHVHVDRLYATLGRYDYVAIFEVSDQNLAFRIASQINAQGVLDTETWPVIPYDEFSRLLQ